MTPEDLPEDHLPSEMTELMAQTKQWLATRRASERSFALPGLDVPWWKEQAPLRVWTHVGIPCAIGPCGSPALAGYVWLSPDHPWRALDLQGDDYTVVDVHGGITFGPHVTGWIGFDTAHGWDAWPDEELDRLPVDGQTRKSWAQMHAVAQMFPIPPDPDDTNWTLDRLIEEVQSLAHQVADAHARKARTRSSDE